MNKQLTILIKKTRLLKNKTTVKIIGETTSPSCYGQEIKADLSILQLAKVWGTDRKIADELSSTGFGSHKLEDKCTETKNLIKKFPNISLWNKKTKFDYVKLTDSKKMIYAEDIVGWNNEGIRIKISKKIHDYLSEKSNKKLSLYMTPFKIKIIAR
jgi:hypothetical protein